MVAPEFRSMLAACLLSLLVPILPAVAQSSRVDSRFHFIQQQALRRDEADKPVAATIRFVTTPSMEELNVRKMVLLK